MKILITGGAGFIGSHTCDALLKTGHQVRVLDLLTEPVHPRQEIPAYLDKRVDFIHGCVTDPRAIKWALRDIDIVFHLAAYQDYFPLFSKFVNTNVSSSALIYETIVKNNLPVKKVIVASSQAAAGEGLYLDGGGQRHLPDMRNNKKLKDKDWDFKHLHWEPTPETVSNPQNPYGMSKIAEEMFSLFLGKRYDIPTVSMRYSIVQGPRQSFYNAYSGACRIFSLAFFTNKNPTIYEDGNQVRDFVNIHDVVDSNLLVMNNDAANFEMFNVGGGRAITINSFARQVAEIFNIQDYTPKISGKYRYGDIRHSVSDISKIKKLGWKPRRTIKDSVEGYKEWLEKSKDIDNILDHCDKQMKKHDVVRNTNE